MTIDSVSADAGRSGSDAGLLIRASTDRYPRFSWVTHATTAEMSLTNAVRN